MQKLRNMKDFQTQNPAKIRRKTSEQMRYEQYIFKQSNECREVKSLGTLATVSLRLQLFSIFIKTLLE